MDDSPENEGEGVVADLSDSRISYTNNKNRLGGAANLDRAFCSQSLIGGDWACVLEDDNWLMPSYLNENIRALELHQVGVLLRNQEVWFQTQQEVKPTGKTTRGTWFEERLYDPIELRAYLFFFEGISNGGLFWNTQIESDLQVGADVRDSGLQEYCRTLQIEEPLYFAAEPLCVWSDMPLDLISRAFAGSRAYSRGIQSLLQFLIRKYGREIIERADHLSSKLSRRAAFEVSLIDALHTDYRFQSVTKLQTVTRYLKSYAKSICVPDPLEDYLSKVELHSVLSPRSTEYPSTVGHLN
jgi:hypothetical protein